ncbi:thioredoxin-like protein [Russula vinacea]|nr:thioredoxin-like protein [Russula vinacea]
MRPYRWKQYSTHNPDGFKNKSAVGVFTPKAAALFILAGTGLYFYLRSEKQRLKSKSVKKEMESRSVGRAHVGGPFEMVTHDGKPFTDKDLLGKWSLIYFGFTNCPDICPEELDKMSAAVTELDKTYGPIVQPIFISVDPARDTLPQMARYVRDFHPRLIGLAGDYATTKATCKAYRVYFSTHPVRNRVMTTSSTTLYSSISWIRRESSSMPLESLARKRTWSKG